MGLERCTRFTAQKYCVKLVVVTWKQGAHFAVCSFALFLHTHKRLGSSFGHSITCGTSISMR